ncbi:MAG: alpha/beta hydrolase [Ruminococcaceae bacterium]|nr:alpha/beta hydrolase [Oscillospiraceae bacterium]
MNFSKGKQKIKFIIATSIVLTLTIIATVFTGYVGDYYRTDLDAVEAFTPMNLVSAEPYDDGTLVFRPENSTKGFIFYPGGKVEYTAYQPLMAACAQQGILCILVEMPFNLAVLDINAAAGIQEQYPEIEKWYIGGHSLGGSMVASYLADHINDYDGLILLGSYSTSDLSETDLNVLSVYGSEDRVMNRAKYEENKSNLPSDFTEVVIEGGCHSYFGMYGAQDGDGKPTISNEQQILLTAEQIIKIME